MPPLQVPDALLPDDVAAQLTAARQPQFVPIPGLPAEEQALALAGGAAGAQGEPQAGAQGPEPVDGHNPAAGVRQLRLSNGIKVNYRRTDNEPSSAMLRLVAMGGRAREGVGVGPSGNGVVAVGTRTLSESGTVGSWQREQVGAALCCAVLGCWRDRCGGHCTCGRASASRRVDSSFLLFVLEPSHVLFLVLQQLQQASCGALASCRGRAVHAAPGPHPHTGSTRSMAPTPTPSPWAQAELFCISKLLMCC